MISANHFELLSIWNEPLFVKLAAPSIFGGHDGAKRERERKGIEKRRVRERAARNNVEYVSSPLPHHHRRQVILVALLFPLTLSWVDPRTLICKRICDEPK